MNSGSSRNSFEMMNVFYFSGIKITWCTGWSGWVGGHSENASKCFLHDLDQ